MTGSLPPWPAPLDENDDELTKEIFAGRVELQKQLHAARQADARAEADSELDSKAEFYKAILEVSKGTIDRAQSGAQAITTAAAAIVTLYTGVLGVTFAAASRPLPPRGVIPAILLGVAVVCATGYQAYLRNSDDRSVPAPEPSSAPRSNEWARARFFILWTRAAAAKRSYWLRSSVLAFAFAVMFLPAAFLAVGRVELGPVSLGTATPKTETPKADWPRVPAARTADLSLQRIRYTAEVKEAASARAGASGSAKDGNDGLWFALGAIALVVSLIPLMRRKPGKVGEAPPPR